MKDDEAVNPKKRALSLLKTVGMVAFEAGKEAICHKLHISAEEPISQAAIRLTAGLDYLKGAAMKVGQLLSMLDENILPKGWKAALSKLQSEATPRPWSQIEPLLMDELGDLDAFSYINPEALHAASIAQVHCAYLHDGQKVAIKIQYPGLEKNIDSDLSNMKKLLKVANILPNAANYDHLFIAIEEMFHHELNFEREKNFYIRYYTEFKDHPHIRVPRPIEDLCTPKVLISEWIDGINLQQWLDSNSQNTQELIRQRIAKLLLEVVFTEIISLHCIQSDPNPGNFLISQDHKLVLLDFGATQNLSEVLVNNYINLLQAGLQKDEDNIIVYAKKMGFIAPTDSAKVHTAFLKIFYLALEPFFDTSYAWQHSALSQRIRAQTLNYMKLTRYRAPSGELLFMNRRLAGNLIVLEKLACEFSARDILLEILNKN